jgi:Cu-Zn family superoxide dismutase
MASGESAVLEYNYGRAKLVDLNLGDATLEDPHATTFDDAYGTLRIKVNPENVTSFKLRVDGIATSAAGTTFGAHLHTDPCDVVGKGGLGGPHYNHDFVLGNVPNRVSTKTEAWFDLVPNDNGVATEDISAPFVPDDSIVVQLGLINQIPGYMSVVIHAQPTNPVTGGAGLRQACLPLSVPDWGPAPTE